MASVTLTRRIALVAGGAAIAAMASVTAGCSSAAKEAPATSSAPSASATPSASTSAAQPSPTDKVTIIQPQPSIEDRGGMDSHSCPPGKTKYNGVCQ